MQSRGSSDATADQVKLFNQQTWAAHTSRWIAPDQRESFRRSARIIHGCLGNMHCALRVNFSIHEDSWCGTWREGWRECTPPLWFVLWRSYLLVPSVGRSLLTKLRDLVWVPRTSTLPREHGSFLPQLAVKMREVDRGQTCTVNLLEDLPRDRQVKPYR